MVFVAGGHEFFFEIYDLAKKHSLGTIGRAYQSMASAYKAESKQKEKEKDKDPKKETVEPLRKPTDTGMPSLISNV